MGVERLRLAVVGCGTIARTYLRALSGVRGLELIAAVDPDTDAARSLAPGQPTHRWVTELLAAAPPEAALVLAPPASHEPVTMELLAAGVHVLCEKPLATSTAAAERMIAAAEAADRLLMMGSKFRYVEDLEAARRLIDDGRLGTPVMLENVFCSRVDMAGRWNADRTVSGGGVLIDNGCHSADIARFLLGPITRVQARLLPRIQDLAVEDTAQLHFEVESGACGSADLSWSLHKEVESYVRVHGSEGTLEVGWTGSRYKTRNSASWTGFGTGYDKVTALRRQLDNFANSIAGTEPPRITAADALSSVAVIDAAYASARDHTWHRVTR